MINLTALTSSLLHRITGVFMLLVVLILKPAVAGQSA
jgi:hypothetical protein